MSEIRGRMRRTEVAKSLKAVGERGVSKWSNMEIRLLRRYKQLKIYKKD